MISELELELRTLEDFRALQEALPELFDPALPALLTEQIRRQGLFDPYMGHVEPASVVIDEDNYRESFIAQGINSRQRAVLLRLKDELGERGEDSAVYASEAVSPLARRLEKHMTNFTGSEYLPSENDRERFPDLAHQDILDLSFDDASFDIYLSCDVLEHIPDLPGAIQEAARILKPGGAFMGTVPFAIAQRKTIIRAIRTDEGLHHLEEPQYHGNPTRPEEGALVYQIPAWDLMDVFRNCGFDDPRLRLMLSSRHGIVSDAPGFVILFYARRISPELRP